MFDEYTFFFVPQNGGISYKVKKCLRHFNPLAPIEAAEKVDTIVYIWYNVIIKYRRWHYG